MLVEIPIRRKPERLRYHGSDSDPRIESSILGPMEFAEIGGARIAYFFSAFMTKGIMKGKCVIVYEKVEREYEHEGLGFASVETELDTSLKAGVEKALKPTAPYFAFWG